jgi:hypothetical protein
MFMKTYAGLQQETAAKVNFLNCCFLLTPQPHRYGEAAFKKAGVRVVSIWWR